VPPWTPPRRLAPGCSCCRLPCPRAQRARARTCGAAATRRPLHARAAPWRWPCGTHRCNDVQGRPSTAAEGALLASSRRDDHTYTLPAQLGMASLPSADEAAGGGRCCSALLLGLRALLLGLRALQQRQLADSGALQTAEAGACCGSVMLADSGQPWTRGRRATRSKISSSRLPFSFLFSFSAPRLSCWRAARRAGPLSSTLLSPLPVDELLARKHGVACGCAAPPRAQQPPFLGACKRHREQLPHRVRGPRPPGRGTAGACARMRSRGCALACWHAYVRAHARAIKR
jgi:hypothetical protein